MDLVAVAERFPKPGETLTGDSFATFPGGKGANQAIAAARLGAKVSMIGKVGSDVFADQYIDVFRVEGVDTAGVAREAGESTGIAVIEVDGSGENHIIIVAGANAKVGADFVAGHTALITACDVFLFQLEVPLPTVVAAAREVSRLGKTVIVDPAPAAPLPDELYRHIDFLTPNESETRLLTGVAVEDEAGAEAAAKVFRDRGVSTPIIKAGKAGAYLYEKGRIVRVPGFDVEAVDTTAAGDSFNGGLAAALARGLTVRDAVRYANAVGALSTTAKGAQTAMPSAAAVEALLKT